MNEHATALLAASRELLLLVDPASLEIVAINDYACTILRRRREEIVGQPITHLECALQDVFYWDEVQSGHFRPLTRAVGLYACGDGEFLPVDKSVTLLAQGEPPRIAICARDARAAVDAEKALARVSSTLQATFESTDEGFLVTDQSGQILNYNARFQQVIGAVVDGTDAHTQIRLLRRVARQTTSPLSAVRTIRRAFTANEDVYACTLTLRDGRSILCRSRPLMMQEQVEGRVISVDDITAQIEHENALAAARDAAAASARAKADFLAMMSHEIRTPLTGILGMTELVLDTAITPTQREYLQMAHQSAEGLLTVINDILDFSRIEAGRMTVEAIPFDLAATLTAAAGPLAWQAQQRGIDFHLHGASAAPCWVVGDPARIRQIVINLVGNAIKFTETGAVTVHLTCTDCARDASRRAVTVAVRDTGIGIPPEKLALIFEAFAQSDTSITRRFGGTGLGLSISSRLATLMGGRIEVSSTPGEGSCFTLALDLAAAPASTAPATAASPPATAARAPGGLSVLLAEDTRVNQVFIASLLRKAGHAVTLAEDGRAAVAAVQAAQAAGAPFDLVLMDIQMPQMDGFAATEVLRQDGCTTPIVALTAHVAEAFRDECLQRGFNDYLSKPIDTDALRQCLARYAMTPVSTPSAGAAPNAAVRVIDRAGDATGVVLDTAAALDRLEGDREVYAALLELAATQMDEDLTSIRTALGAGDAAAVARNAHRLKGSLAAIGATRAEAAAKALEHVAKSATPSGLDALTSALDDALAAVRRVLPEQLANLQQSSDPTP